MAAPRPPRPPIPGMNPRPQKFFINQVNGAEVFESENRSTFIYLEKCEEFSLEIKGKVGKVVCERNTKLKLVLNQRVVGGTLELIHCHDVEITCDSEAQIPILTVDGSSAVHLNIQRKDQIENIYCHNSRNITVIVNPPNSEAIQQFKLDLEGKVSYAEGDVAVQWVSHWSSKEEDAVMVTEQVLREGIYPITAEEKRAAEQRKQQAMTRMMNVTSGP